MGDKKMSDFQKFLKVPNSLAEDSIVAGVFHEVDERLFHLIDSGQIKNKPIHICSGGTTSQCAANQHWTLDLRENYRDLNFSPSKQEIEIGGGVKMSELMTTISKYAQSFPIGLSSSTGVGYILTGGISPISRNRGLAIDQIIKIKGVWGSGERFEIIKPTFSSNDHTKKCWKGLCGAAPFLGIVTSITLKTHKIKPIFTFQTIIRMDQLAECINIAEGWPNNASLQWIWGDQIRIFVVIEMNDGLMDKEVENLIKDLPNKELAKIKKIKSISELPKFTVPLNEKSSDLRMHSEVIGLLGKNWGNKSIELIRSINELMKNRPNNNCYIASQQLGGETTTKTESSFIHRDSIWKPWINAAWPAGEMTTREESLSWLKEVWQQMESLCPGVHLAQLHPHLDIHEREIKAAFKNWLPELQTLKTVHDPKGILPPL